MAATYTAKMAYEFVKYQYPEYNISGGLEFDDYYCFAFESKNGEKLLDAFVCIDKKSGKQLNVSPFSNLSLLAKAKQIKL